MIGLSLLCALAFSAFSAPSASAIKGTTAFTCVKGGIESELRGEHCLTKGSAPSEYSHEALEAGMSTEVEATNEKTASTTTAADEPLVTAVIAGVQYEKSCETIYMRVSGEKIVGKASNCELKGVFQEMGCKLVGSEFESNELGAVTTDNSMTAEFIPP